MSAREPFWKITSEGRKRGGEKKAKKTPIVHFNDTSLCRRLILFVALSANGIPDWLRQRQPGMSLSGLPFVERSI